MTDRTRARRQQVLWRVVTALAVVVGVLATAATLTTGETAEVLSAATVAALVGAPLVRVAWLAARWFRLGDYRFAVTAAGLLALSGVAYVVA